MPERARIQMMTEWNGKFDYDPDLETVFVTMAGVPVETREQIRDHFERVHRYWRTTCRGRSVYFVIDYDGFTMNLAELDYYAQQVKRISELCTAVTVVRYGGDPLSRTGNRLISMKLHTPSNLYGTREQAIAVVQGIRAGKVALQTG
jgi:hypothetical protein